MAAPTIEEALAARSGAIPRKEMSASRKVFWPMGGEWVYKFDGNDGYCSKQNNIEWAVYQYIQEHPELLPASTRVPETRKLVDEHGNTVIAMRYIKGQTPKYCPPYRGRGTRPCQCPKSREKCWWREVNRTDQDNADPDAYQPSIINDMHCNNVLLDENDVFWMVDLGYGSEEVGVSGPNWFGG